MSVTRLGPGGTPIAALEDPGTAIEATLAATEGFDDAALTAKITISATLNVSPLLGFTADSTEITADDTGHTADEYGFDPSRGEGADTFAATARVGEVVVVPVVDGGSAFDPRLLPSQISPAPVEARFAATEGSDSVSGLLKISALANFAAAEGVDEFSASVVVSISASMAVVEGADSAHLSVAVNESLADDEIMALLFAEAA